jgi:hypothetical protein
MDSQLPSFLEINFMKYLPWCPDGVTLPHDATGCGGMFHVSRPAATQWWFFLINYLEGGLF